MTRPRPRRHARRCRSAAVLASVAVLAGPAVAQDAARMQPQSYRVVLDNEKARVLEFDARPGMGVCGVGIHSHPPHITVLLTPAKVRVTQNGKTTVVIGKAGDAFYEPAVTHEVEDVGGGPVRTLIIELKSAPPGRGR